MSEKSTSRFTILPNSYNRKSVILTTNNTKTSEGFDFDINLLVTRVEVIENIESPALEFVVSVGDTENYIERLRLSGNEKISFEFEKNAHYGKEKYSLECRIIEILNFVKQKRGLTTYQMRCVSPHIFTNQVVSLGKSFSGSVGKTIKDVCTNDLDIPNKKLDIDTATPQIKGVFPKLRPLSGINFLLANSYDDGTPYYFYETFTNGIKFKSLKQLVDQEPFDKYFLKETSNTNLESDEGFEEMRTRIVEISSEYNVSKFMGLQEGAYASTTHLFDVAEKKPSKEIFKYSYNSNTHFEENKPFPTLEKNNLIKEKSFKDFPDAKNFFVNLNSSSFDEIENYSAQQKNHNTGKVYSHLENMEFQSHSILIPGDFRLSVGMIIEIELPETTEKGKRESKVNKVQSGKYLITGIVHDLKTDEYMMTLTIRRNASSIPLDTEEEIVI